MIPELYTYGFYRGVEIVSFEAGNNFVGRSTASDSELTDIDLTDKDWAGYDE